MGGRSLLSGIDPVVYQTAQTTRWTFPFSMRHCQTLNSKRLNRGSDAFLKVFGEEEAPSKSFLGNLPNTPPKVPGNEPKGEISSENTENPILKSVLATYSNSYLQCDEGTRNFMRRLSEVLEKQAFGQKERLICRTTNQPKMGRVGIEPTTPAFSGPCSTN